MSAPDTAAALAALTRLDEACDRALWSWECAEDDDDD